MKARQKTIEVNFTDPTTDEKFNGVLTLKRKTMQTEIDIRALKSDMMGGRMFTSKEDELSIEMMATVFLVFTDPDERAKEWFSREDMTSQRLLAHMYELHRDFEISFWRSDKRNEYRRLNKQLVEASSTGDTVEHKEESRDLVGEDVSPAQGEFTRETIVG